MPALSFNYHWCLINLVLHSHTVYIEKYLWSLRRTFRITYKIKLYEMFRYITPKLSTQLKVSPQCQSVSGLVHIVAIIADTPLCSVLLCIWTVVLVKCSYTSIDFALIQFRLIMRAQVYLFTRQSDSVFSSVNWQTKFDIVCYQSDKSELVFYLLFGKNVVYINFGSQIKQFGLLFSYFKLWSFVLVVVFVNNFFVGTDMNYTFE